MAQPPGGFAQHEMVAAAEPLAVQAGLRVLHAGGTAADAAVAIQAVLALVEPQSSSLSGGAFMVFYDGATHKLTSYNGRETAPAGATPDMFLNSDGKPMSYAQAVLSGRSTGAPGAIAMLALAHREHGRLAWSGLFDEAIALADQGFPVTPRLAADIIDTRFPQSGAPDVIAYFRKGDGQPYRLGEPLRNPAFAATVRKLAAEGPSALLTGRVARDIADRVHQTPIPGTLSAADIAAYHPKATAPLCRPFNVYVVCAPALPSGGVGLLELLGELDATDIAARRPSDPQAWFEFAQASRLMYADRDHFEGDPKAVSVPVAGLLNPAYEAARAGLIAITGAAAPDPGTPAGAAASGKDHTAEPGGTTDFAVVDRFGDVVSMTTTVESIFGSGRMVDGFFLNNQLTDFSFSPAEPSGVAAANAAAPGKQPRSSMSPVIVLDRQGRFVMALGSPGGNSIIAYVAKVLVGLIDWKLPIDQALALPNIVARGGAVAVERGADPAIIAGLRAHGLNVQADQGEESGVQVIVATPHGLQGGADARREGVARGD